MHLYILSGLMYNFQSVLPPELNLLSLAYLFCFQRKEVGGGHHVPPQMLSQQSHWTTPQGLPGRSDLAAPCRQSPDPTEVAGGIPSHRNSHPHPRCANFPKQLSLP